MQYFTSISAQCLIPSVNVEFDPQQIEDGYGINSQSISDGALIQLTKNVADTGEGQDFTTSINGITDDRFSIPENSGNLQRKVPKILMVLLILLLMAIIQVLIRLHYLHLLMG